MALTSGISASQKSESTLIVGLVVSYKNAFILAIYLVRFKAASFSAKGLIFLRTVSPFNYPLLFCDLYKQLEIF